MIDIPSTTYYILAAFTAGLLLGLRRGKTSRNKAQAKAKELRKELRQTTKRLQTVAAAITE